MNTTRKSHRILILVAIAFPGLLLFSVCSGFLYFTCADGWPDYRRQPIPHYAGFVIDIDDDGVCRGIHITEVWSRILVSLPMDSNSSTRAPKTIDQLTAEDFRILRWEESKSHISSNGKVTSEAKNLMFEYSMGSRFENRGLALFDDQLRCHNLTVLSLPNWSFSTSADGPFHTFPFPSSELVERFGRPKKWVYPEISFDLTHFR